jgi:hypothetical protein
LSTRDEHNVNNRLRISPLPGLWNFGQLVQDCGWSKRTWSSCASPLGDRSHSAFSIFFNFFSGPTDEEPAIAKKHVPPCSQILRHIAISVLVGLAFNYAGFNCWAGYALLC